jgi:hypothetical protein
MPLQFIMFFAFNNKWKGEVLHPYNQRFASMARRPPPSCRRAIYISNSWDPPLENIKINVMGDHDRV